MRRRVTALAAALVLAGCAGYVPSAPSETPQSTAPEATAPAAEAATSSAPPATTTTLPPPPPEEPVLEAAARVVVPPIAPAPAVPDPPVPPPDATAEPGGALAPGDRGWIVTMLQERLGAGGFYRGEADGEYGEWTVHAVVAFHKAIDAPRDQGWFAEDWDRLAAFDAPELPAREEEPDRIEIDLTRQVLYLVRDEAVAALIPISSGNGASFVNSSGNTVRARTPTGDFEIYFHREGWHKSYLGYMYEPWYFRGGYAVHGSNSVPAEPASHGCVRIPNWEADFLADQLFVGMPVHIWQSG